MTTEHKYDEINIVMSSADIMESSLPPLTAMLALFWLAFSRIAI
jgi:hypothetical protein